jgi:chromate transporter
MSEQAAGVSERTVGSAELAGVFLKIGAMSYGGPAIMGIMQAEIQEKRGWISKEEFVEGLALVNMLPGPGATQLGIFIGHAKAGLAGGLIAGVCFILPAFLIMLALAAAYVALGTLPAMRNAFYGIGPVVVGIFAVSAYRLGRASIRERSQIAIAVAVAIVLFFTPIGLVLPLMAAGCAGIALFYSRRTGLIALAILLAAFASYYLIDIALTRFITPTAVIATQSNPTSSSLWELAAFFSKVGAFTFGGGLSMLAFMQEQVVNQFHWLTPQEFVDGLALGQLTPGPILMLAAFIGFKLGGVTGAAVAGWAIFFPSFLMMLLVLPLLRKLKDLQWLRAFMRGVGPAVIGALAVSLAQMAPHAAPDVFTCVLLALTIGILLLRNVGPLPLMAGAAVIGLLSGGNFLQRVEELMR